MSAGAFGLVSVHSLNSAFTNSTAIVRSKKHKKTILKKDPPTHSPVIITCILNPICVSGSRRRFTSADSGKVKRARAARADKMVATMKMGDQRVKRPVPKPMPKYRKMKNSDSCAKVFDVI